MVLVSEIENTYKEQSEYIKLKSKSTQREFFLDKKNTGNFIEIITGVRRSGKSTLMNQIKDKVKGKIAYFNFEDSRVYGFDVSDFQKLDLVIGKGVKVYFFDEVQNVPQWELFIRQLHDRGEKIYVTGSNASLLSKELGTRLTGRHVRHEMFPFSYSEFLTHKKLKVSDKSFETYLYNGGFPDFVNTQNIDFMQNLLKDIVLRDIAIRYSIRNTKLLMDITLFLLSNIGKETSYNSLSKAYNIGSVNTVSDYLTWLEDAYILMYLPRFSWSARSISINPRKVYAIDNGLVRSNSLSFSRDRGRMLENLVYINLRKKYEKLYYFREKGECDFVVFERETSLKVIQVTELLHLDNKDREINGLVEAMDFFNLKVGYILTMNQEEEILLGDKKIVVMKVRDFV